MRCLHRTARFMKPPQAGCSMCRLRKSLKAHPYGKKARLPNSPLATARSVGALKAMGGARDGAKRG